MHQETNSQVARIYPHRNHTQKNSIDFNDLFGFWNFICERRELVFANRVQRLCQFILTPTWWGRYCVFHGATYLWRVLFK